MLINKPAIQQKMNTGSIYGKPRPNTLAKEKEDGGIKVLSDEIIKLQVTRIHSMRHAILKNLFMRCWVRMFKYLPGLLFWFPDILFVEKWVNM